MEDNPKAAGIASKVVGELAAAGHLTLGPCLRPILEARGGAGLDDEEGAEEEDLPPLVAAGVAGEDVLGNVLAAVGAGGGWGWGPFQRTRLGRRPWYRGR